MLTHVLPDDTALQSVRIQSSKVTISGLTENASALMQKLSNQDGVKDVRAPSAATRIGAGNKESFTIELGLDAKVFGPKTVQEVEAAVKTQVAEQSNASIDAAAGTLLPATQGTAPAAAPPQPPAPSSANAVAPASPPPANTAAAATAPGQAPRPPSKATLGGSAPRATLGGSVTPPPDAGGKKP